MLLHESHLPHSLRLTILFIRITVGLTFFYLGWTMLFNTTLSSALRERSVSGLYAWLASPTPIAAVPAAVFAWIFIVIGACIALGLFTRIAAIIAILLTLAGWLPSVSFSGFNPAQFINDEVIIVLALLVLIFSSAGHYFGLDTVTRYWKRRKS